MSRAKDGTPRPIPLDPWMDDLEAFYRRPGRRVLPGIPIALKHVVTTQSALATLTDNDIQQALIRHRYGDWGLCTPEEDRANIRALSTHDRLLSMYHCFHAGKLFYVLTDAGWELTTLLLHDDVVKRTRSRSRH